MTNPETRNVKIASTMLGIEDHGIFSFFLYLEWPGGGQGAGGYALDAYDKSLDRRVGMGASFDLLAEIMRVVGVEKWESLPGKYIRIVHDSGKVSKIGNLLEDNWLDFEQFFKDRYKD